MDISDFPLNRSTFWNWIYSNFHCFSLWSLWQCYDNVLTLFLQLCNIPAKIMHLQR